MNVRYRVIFLGLVESKDRFIEGMSRLGVSSETVEQVVNKAPVILKEGMNLGYARKYADAIQDAGGKINIKEHIFLGEPKEGDSAFEIEPLENFTRCPECGHKQLKVEACVKCGYVFKEE